MIIIFCVLLSVINFYFIVKILSEKPHQKDIQDFQTQTERLMVEFNRITTRNIDLLDSRIEELNHKIRQSQKTEALLKELFEEAQKIEHLSSIIPNRRSSDGQLTVSTGAVDNTTDGQLSVSTGDVDNIVEITDRQLSVSTNTDDDIILNDTTNIVDEYLNDNPSFEELISLNKPSLVSSGTVNTTNDTVDNIVEVKDSENQRSRHSSVSTNTTDNTVDNTTDTIDDISTQIQESFNTSDETPPNNVTEVEDVQLSDGQSTDSLFEGVSVDKIKKHRKKSKNSQELLKKYIQENKTKEELLEMGYNINEINLMNLVLEENTK